MSRLQVEERIAALEERTRALEARVGIAPLRAESVAPPRAESAAPRRVERVAPPPPPRVSPAPSASLAGSPNPAIPAAAPLRLLDLEDLLGGRVLAWVGGLAVAVGVIFLLATAISQGWIGEAERTVIAGLLSGGLLVAGIRAHGRRGRTDAAKAATAAGIVGLFATTVVAGAVYELVPALVALAGAVAVGATATAVAVRWAAPGIAALGILGAILAPALFGTLLDGTAILLLLVATASATAVVIWQRWTWLAIATYVLATPQWIVYAADQHTDARVVTVMAAFGIVGAAAAIGFEIRERARAVPVRSVVLLAVNAFVLGAVGVLELLPAHANAWLVALALAHAAVGLAGRRTTRISPDLAIAALAIGVVLADVAAARILGGLPLALGWVASALVFAGLMRLATPGMDRRAALAGLGGHLTLALAQALLIRDGGHEIALVIVAATSLVSGRLADEGRTTLRMVLDAVALAVLAYVTAVTLDGLALTLALASETVALIAIARRHREDDVAVGGAVAFAALTTLHAIAVHAPPDALYDGLAHPLEAAAALAAAAVVVALTGRVAPRIAHWSVGGAAVLALYAASVELVTPFADVPQQAQALLSVLWALTGVAMLVAGLIRAEAALRHAALALLSVTATKVFLYDLASLTSLYRVASFIALGLLLLAGAFAWQRIRPRPQPDLRKVPVSLR